MDELLRQVASFKNVKITSRFLAIKLEANDRWIDEAIVGATFPAFPNIVIERVYGRQKYSYEIYTSLLPRIKSELAKNGRLTKRREELIDELIKVFNHG